MPLQRVLVSGASGFVGSAIIRRLSSLQNAVPAAIVRPESDLWRLADLRPELVFLDLLDSAGVRAEVSRLRPDAIIHCAMYNGHPEDATSREACFQISTLGTLHLLEAARECNAAFVCMGSSLIYAPSEAPLTEESKIDPHTVRGAAKAASLVLFRQLSRLWGMRSCELRIFSAYGPRQQPNRFIPKLLRAAESGETVPVRPGPRHDYVHIDDIADACMLALDKIEVFEPAEAFNIGGGTERTNEETVAAVERATGRKINLASDLYTGQHPSDAEHWCADISKAARMLHWRPSIAFDAGLRSTYQWQNNQQRQRTGNTC